MEGNLIIHNATVVTPIGRKARRGNEMGSLTIIKDATIISEGGLITYVGPSSEIPAANADICYDEFDAAGKVVLPGFIDSHTHLIFGGYRPDEFGWRMRGESYMSIMQRGGGIQSTVNATREASEQELADKARWFVDKMSEMGVTTVEVKSGYGLDTPSEMKMLNAIENLTESRKDKIRIVSTFLGAHAVPQEYKGRTKEYCDLIITEMIPRVKGKAKFFDIFTEKNVFEIEESRRLLNSAREAGFNLKLHADEIVALGGAELAAEVGAVSADHLLHISENGMQAMAKSGTVATLLPLTAFSLKEEYAPARKIIDAGCAVALATDLNPGSCFSGSIPLTIALACIYMGMSVEETITALTLNGAAALGIADSTGSIEVGKSADFAVLSFDNYNFLPYYIGMNCVESVFYKGNGINDK